jgi:hypothetical protein
MGEKGSKLGDEKGQEKKKRERRQPKRENNRHTNTRWKSSQVTIGVCQLSDCACAWCAKCKREGMWALRKMASRQGVEGRRLKSWEAKLPRRQASYLSASAAKIRYAGLTARLALQWLHDKRAPTNACAERAAFRRRMRCWATLADPASISRPELRAPDERAGLDDLGRIRERARTRLPGEYKQASDQAKKGFWSYLDPALTACQTACLGSTLDLLFRASASNETRVVRQRVARHRVWMKSIRWRGGQWGVGVEGHAAWRAHSDW